jgi:hypothetical protein
LPNYEAPIDTPETELEKFIKADYPSHLLKIAELENFINISKQSTKIIDETDISGAALWDYIEPEVQDEIKAQLEGLKSVSAVKDSLRTELKSLASHTWESHKETLSGTEHERYKHYETMMLGSEPKIRDQKDLLSVKSDILDAEEVYEMLALEKMRMTMAAAICSPEEKPLKEAEAFEIMGEEYSLIKSQMEHLEKTLETDWLKSVPGEGIMNPAVGKTLICPEIAARMKTEPSEEQLKALEDTYKHMADRRGEEHSLRDKNTEKTGFCVASMQFLEMGKKAKFMNAFKSIRDTSKEKIEEIKENAQETPDEIETPDEVSTEASMLKRGLDSIKSGVGKAIKGSPGILAAQIWIMTKNKANKEYSGHYGRQDDLVSFTKELGLARIDDPL